jgi:hypothetical protein
LDLQLGLIDNFRRRLVQLHNNGVGTAKILNTIYYVNSVLQEWGENVVSKRIRRHFIAHYSPRTIHREKIKIPLDEFLILLDYC